MFLDLRPFAPSSPYMLKLRAYNEQGLVSLATDTCQSQLGLFSIKVDGGPPHTFRVLLGRCGSALDLKTNCASLASGDSGGLL